MKHRECGKASNEVVDELGEVWRFKSLASILQILQKDGGYEKNIKPGLSVDG